MRNTPQQAQINTTNQQFGISILPDRQLKQETPKYKQILTSDGNLRLIDIPQDLHGASGEDEKPITKNITSTADSDGKTIENLITSEDGKSAYIVNPKTGEVTSRANGDLLTVDLQRVKNLNITDADVKATENAASIFDRTKGLLLRNDPATIVEIETLAKEADQIFQHFPEARHGIHEMLRYTNPPPHLEYAPHKEGSLYLQKKEELIVNPENLIKARENGEFETSFKDEDALDNHFKARGVAEREYSSSVTRLFTFAEYAATRERLSELAQLRNQGKLKNNREINYLQNRILSLTSSISSDKLALSSKEMDEELKALHSDVTKKHVNYASLLGYPNQDVSPHTTENQQDMQQNTVVKYVDHAADAALFLVGPAGRGFKVAAKGITAGAVGFKTLKAAQDASHTHITSAMKGLGFDVTNADDMIDFAKNHPEIMQQAANQSTQAMIAAFVSNFGAGKVAEKLRYTLGFGDVGEIVIDEIGSNVAKQFEPNLPN